MQGLEEGRRAVQPVPQHQGVAREPVQGGHGPREFAGRGVGVEDQRPTQPAPEIVDPEQAAGQHHRPLVPEQLQPPRDRGQPRAVEHHDRGEPRLHLGHLRRVARRDGGQHPRGKPPEHLDKEGGPQVPAALKEGLRGRRHAREERLALLEPVGQGLAQGRGRPQNDGHPELHQRGQRPHPLPLGPAHPPKGRVTQGGGDVRLQQLRQPQQVDVRPGPSGHSTSRGWGSYGPVNPT